MKNWIKDRLNERTSLDGVVLIGAGVAFLIFKPIASLVAYGAMWEMINRMFGDTLWIYTAIAGSLLGAAFLAWFRNTHAALYLMGKFDGFLDYLVDRFGWDWLQDDPEAWRKRYPKVTKKIDDLESRLQKIEGKLHDNGDDISGA